MSSVRLSVLEQSGHMTAGSTAEGKHPSMRSSSGRLLRALSSGSLLRPSSAQAAKPTKHRRHSLPIKLIGGRVLPTNQKKRFLWSKPLSDLGLDPPGIIPSEALSLLGRRVTISAEGRKVSEQLLPTWHMATNPYPYPYPYPYSEL